MQRTNSARRERRRRTAAVTILVAVGLFGLSLVSQAVSAAAPGSPPPPGTPIDQWSQGQIEAQLAEWAPGIAAMEADGSLLDGVPADQVETVQHLADLIGTSAGRAQLASEVRAAETDPTLMAAAAADDDPVSTYEAPSPGLPDVDPPGGDTTPKVKSALVPNSQGVGTLSPSGTKDGTTTGGGRGGERGGPEGTLPNCPKQGTLADPDKAPMSFLTPTHDTFMGTSPDFPLFTGNRELLTGTDGRKYLKVVVLMEDTKKHWPVGALDARVWLKKSIGDHAGTPYSAIGAVAGAPAGNGVYCFAGSDGTGKRGYAVVMVPMTADVVDPGFHLYAELIERDAWFQFGSNQWDVALAPTGPQYWAGGNQLTIHVGPAPATTRTPLTPAIGAFVDKGLIVDDDNNPANDLQALLSQTLRTRISNFLSAFQTDDLVGQWAFNSLTPKKFTDWTWEGEGQASFSWDSNNPPNALDWAGLVFGGLLAQLIDLLGSFKITGIANSAPESLGLSWSGLGQGDSDAALKVGASFNDAEVKGKLRFFGVFWCKGSLEVDALGQFRGWAEEGIPATGIRTHGDGSISNLSVHDLWMPWYNWARPNCVAGWLLAKLIAKGVAAKAMTDAVLGLLVADGATPSTLEKLVNGLNVPGMVSGITLPGGIHPAFTGFRDSCAPSACATDESFLQTLGLDVMADGTLGTSGAAFGGQWPAVYTPTTTTPVATLIRSHTNAGGVMRDVGAVAEARLIEVLLHDLTAAGLVNLTVGDATVVPTIVPVYDAAATTPAAPFTFVVPDLRVSVQGLKVALSAKLGVGATIDAASGVLDPTVQVQPEIEALECLVDYVNAYGISYGLCGHSNPGNFGLPTLPQVIDQVITQVASKLVDDTLGQLKIPTPSALAPGVPLSFNTVEVQNRGGHVALYADRTADDPGTASVQIWQPQPYFTFTAEPSGFPGSGPYTVSWQVKDLESGQLFSTAGCTLTCFVPGWMFQQGHPPGTENPKWKRAEATVTITRAGITRTVSAIQTWIL